MKVLLMVAPSEDALTLEASNDIAQNMGYFPPLGILYVGTYLKEHSSHEVHIVDTETERLNFDEIEKRVKKIRPDVIGVTTFTNTLRNVLDLIKMVKRVLPGCIVVLGGPHIPLFPEETIGFDEVDYAISGDGEYSFKALLDVLEQNLSNDIKDKKLQEIQGIVFKTTDGLIYKNGYARVKDINSLPFPDRNLLKKELYYCILGKNRLMTTIMSSRGCPFHCTFCNTPDKIYRFRSPQSVVDEIESVVAMGVEEAFFFDDLFNINEKRVIEICDEIIKRKIQIKWAFRGRVNGITEELVRKAKLAGCERIQYGIEKATDEGLKKVKKDSTVEEIKRAVNLTKKYGLMCVGNFLFFTPGEDEDDVEEIIRFSLKLNLDHAEFSVFIPYPGTKIYEEGLKSGFIEKDYWREYAKNPTKAFQIVWEEKVRKEKMYYISNKAHKRFYLRPRIIWNEFKRISSLKEFMRVARGALIILTLK